MIKVTYVEDTATAVKIQVAGELDSAAVEEFNESITPILNQANREITLDLQELEFISSAGLRSLLLMNKKALADGGTVVLVNARKEIMQVFSLTGFDTFMTIR